MNIVTRFAPSPTGFLHIGGARTALFNYLFAKNTGGKFLLRIEDTDQKRSTEAAVQAIIDGMEWLGLKHDDEIVFQSKNGLRHKQVAEELVEKGQAYYCYTAVEELDEMRKNAEAKGEVFRFQSPWRQKNSSQTLSQTSTVKPVIRIKAPQDGETIIDDIVQGQVRVSNVELDDLVMLRGDGTPTYMLAAVVDDHDMGITHVIRGDDHFTNAFRQKIIYQAMGWDIPKFAHIPLIFGSDGAKMSKRHGATSVMEYKEMGYLSEALRNYLLRLGWSHGDAEIISDAQAIEWFNLEKIGKSPARFDFSKLDNLNKHYIKEKSEEELFSLVKENFSKQISDSSKVKILKALKFSKERAIKLFDLISLTEFYIDGFKKDFAEKDLEILKNSSQIILELKEIISKIENWNHDGIKNAINDFALSKNLKMKDFGPALRVALTFSSSTPGGVFDVIEILGKEEVVRRINS